MLNRTIATVFLATTSTTILAADFTDTARVISSTPIYERVNEPRQQCWNTTENVYPNRRQDRSYTGSILGGVAGGLIGNQVGQGRGNTAATAAGAVVGAIVGDRIDNRDNGYYGPEARQVQRCRQVDSYREVITGYNVVYRYSGRDITTTLPYDPGRTVKVRVSLVEDGAQNIGYYGEGRY